MLNILLIYELLFLKLVAISCIPLCFYLPEYGDLIVETYMEVHAYV